MLKIALVLGLAVAALATTVVKKDRPHQTIRLGSVGNTYSYFKGLILPYTKHVVEGIPAYELRRMVDGVPRPEEDLLNFRCHYVDPVDTVDKPAYVCRNLNLKKESTAGDDRITFYLSAEELKTVSGKEIDLWIGRTMCRDITSGVHTRVLDDTTEHVVRVGSIGTSFAHLNGFLVPYTSHVTEGIPAFEFRSMVDGVAKKEEKLIDFRCGLLNNYYVPIETENKPVYMCRHYCPQYTCPDHLKTLLFSAENLNIEPGKKVIDLWLGRTMWKDFISDVYTTTYRDEASMHGIRFASIGSHFADMRAIIVPYNKGAVEGIPSYELRSIVKGVPIEEHDLVSFRCHHLDEYTIPIETISKPVYLCRSHNRLRNILPADRTAFLFSAQDFDIPASTKYFDLWLGRTLWRDFTSDILTRTH